MTPTVCYSVRSILEVSGDCQSGNIIYLRQLGITIAKSIDHSSIHGFLGKLGIHRLRSAIYGSRRSTYSLYCGGKVTNIVYQPLKIRCSILRSRRFLFVSSSSYNFSDALHMRSIMHCCWRGVRGCLNNFSGCYCKI